MQAIELMAKDKTYSDEESGDTILWDNRHGVRAVDSSFHTKARVQAGDPESRAGAIKKHLYMTTELEKQHMQHQIWIQKYNLKQYQN